MANNSVHPDYTSHAPAWTRARDVLAGEDAVKAAGEKYLPRLESQTDEEYAAYKARASFFGATSRTLQEYLDLVFRRSPALALGTNETLQTFAADCDLWGLDFLRYARRVVTEVLSVGRAGSLVLWDHPTARPWVSLFKTEDILDWSVERAGEHATLIRLVLREPEGLRLLRLQNGECVQEMWRLPAGTSSTSSPSPIDLVGTRSTASPSAPAPARGEAELVPAAWALAETHVLQRQGVPLPFIPFAFHGPSHSRPEPGKLPLAEIIAANLDHYRLDADYKHGLHFAALPTAWVSGFDRSAELRIGSTTAWVSDLPGATAGFLEFSGAGLAYIERAMDRVERRLTLLGAKMLERRAADGEEGGSKAGELSGLGHIVASLNQSLSRVLQLAQWWAVGGELAKAGTAVSLTLNTDLSARAMTGNDLAAVVAAWRAGALSRESMLELLKRGEILPDGRSVSQEKALIHRGSGSGAAVG